MTTVPPAGRAGGPLVSVLLSSRNGSRFLNEALDSLARQTWPQVEIIAVDDGSTDTTGDLLAAFAVRHGNTRVLRTSGLGLAGALALAARDARGTYLARHDDDDRSRPVRLERQVRFLESHPTIVALGTEAVRLDESGRELGLYGVPIDPPDIRRVARRDPPFVHGSVMIRRAAYDGAGGYRPAFRSSEDLDLWLRLPIEGMANLSEPLYAWRAHPAGSFARARDTMLDYAAIARAFARERRETGRDSVELLEAHPGAEAMLAVYPRAGSLALELGLAYLRDGRVAEARRFLGRAARCGGSRVRAVALWILSFGVALTPRAVSARTAAERR